MRLILPCSITWRRPTTREDTLDTHCNANGIWLLLEKNGSWWVFCWWGGDLLNKRGQIARTPDFGRTVDFTKEFFSLDKLFEGFSNWELDIESWGAIRRWIFCFIRLAALAVLCPDNPFYLKVTSKLKLVFKMVCMAYLSLAIASIFKDKFHLAKRRVKLKKHNIMIFAATPRPPPFCLAMSRD